MLEKFISNSAQKAITWSIFLGVVVYICMQLLTFMSIPRFNDETFLFKSFLHERKSALQPYISYLAAVMVSEARFIDQECLTRLQNNKGFMVNLEFLLSEKCTETLLQFLSKTLAACVENSLIFNQYAYVNLTRSNSTPIGPHPPTMETKAKGGTSASRNLENYHNNHDCLAGKEKLSEEIPIDFSKPAPAMSELEEEYKLLQIGGSYPGPRFCKPRQFVALIIPYRDRNVHLRYWLYYMLPSLIKQHLRFTIFVVEQQGNAVFNKGQLMNTAFLWASSHENFDCYIFHDVDMILQVPANFYQCDDGRFVRHLSPYIDKYNYTTLRKFDLTVGGASAFKEWQYRTVNGYSNLYWGWGAEDDDIFIRMKYRGLKRSRPDKPIGRYKMIPHERDGGNPENQSRFKLLRKTRKRISTDGLSDLKTEILRVTLYPLFTHILVNLPEHKYHMVTTSVPSSTTTDRNTSTAENKHSRISR